MAVWLGGWMGADAESTLIVTSVRELMAAAYNSEFVVSLARFIQDMLNGMAG